MDKYSDIHVKTLCQWALAFSHSENSYNTPNKIYPEKNILQTARKSGSNCLVTQLSDTYDDGTCEMFEGDCECKGMSIHMGDERRSQTTLKPCRFTFDNLTSTCTSGTQVFRAIRTGGTNFNKSKYEVIH